MAKRNVPKSNSRTRGLILIIIGTFFVSVSTIHNILRLRSLRLDDATVQAYVDSKSQQELAITNDPVHIYIKWFVDTAIEPALYKSGEWTISPDQASYLVSSGQVGSPGNMIIYGHNTRAILGNIRALKGYETITLTLTDGSKRDYKIVSLKEVSPTDVSALQPTTQEVLTIYTCSGFMDSKRFVVRAEPLIPG